MSTLREAAQEFVDDYENGDMSALKHYARALRAALEQQEQEQEPVALFTKYGPPTMRDRDFWSAGYAAGAARAIEQALKEKNHE
jgi:hypothetical protein